MHACIGCISAYTCINRELCWVADGGAPVKRDHRPPPVICSADTGQRAGLYLSFVLWDI